MSDRVIAVYLLASQRNGTLYLGVTSDLARRMWEHKQGLHCAFTHKYGVNRLVWFETADWYDGARQREVAMKGWRRAWKIALIEKMNPQWLDLDPTLT